MIYTKIAEFVLDNVNKTYFLPSIQREFVWDQERMIRLFDSILQRYPIGNMLSWSYNKNKELSVNDVGHQYNFQHIVLVTKYRHKMFKN